MDKRRLAEDRSAIQSAIDILTKLSTGHELRMVHGAVHGVSTRTIVTVRDELKQVMTRMGNHAE